ncbi:hypothetical protein HID58_022008 [Brassica napus]|uniref:Uncharacterized protein n=1 Tax=Brassica napus TaxID=3708 RepID=A0ABQ8CY01_BRANA|nr:hypothetical protein HID58_022008 [Brassica napus]
MKWRFCLLRCAPSGEINDGTHRSFSLHLYVSLLLSASLHLSPPLAASPLLATSLLLSASLGVFPPLAASSVLSTSRRLSAYRHLSASLRLSASLPQFANVFVFVFVSVTILISLNNVIVCVRDCYYTDFAEQKADKSVDHTDVVADEETSSVQVAGKGKRKFLDEGAETRKKKVLCKRSAENFLTFGPETKSFIEGLIRTSVTSLGDVLSMQMANMERVFTERMGKMEIEVSQLKDAISLTGEGSYPSKKETEEAPLNSKAKQAPPKSKGAQAPPKSKGAEAPPKRKGDQPTPTKKHSMAFWKIKKPRMSEISLLSFGS